MRRIWNELRREPAILITLIVAFALLIYFVYKNQQNTSTTAPSTDYGTIFAVDVTPPPPEVAGPPGPTGPPGKKGPPGPKGPGQPTPGTTYRGPSGVLHYVATGNETLSQIATKFHVGTWNSIYAIPDNQKLFGKLNYRAARSYIPPAGMGITLPGNAKI